MRWDGIEEGLRWDGGRGWDGTARDKIWNYFDMICHKLILHYH